MLRNLADAARVNLRHRPLHCFVALALLLVVVFQAWLRLLACSTRSIHWDEFNFLRIVHAAERGELTSFFQTFHARLFFWLPALDINEVDQIIFARHVIWLAHLMAIGALALLGRRLAGRIASLWACCLLGSAWFVIQHGCSFRYDGVLLPAYAASLWLLTQRSKLASGCAGVLSALGLLVSLKIALFAPALLAFAFLRRDAEPARERRKLGQAYLLSGAISLLVMGALHGWGLGRGGGGFAPAKYTEGMFQLGNLFPRWQELRATLLADSLVWVLLASGGALLLASALVSRAQRRSLISTFLVGAPLLSLCVYRNAWPYFIATVMTVGSVWLAYVPGLLLRTTRVWQTRGVLVAMCCIGLFSGLTAQAWHRANDEDQTERQRVVIATAKALFPTPVPYIDRCAMISSYPKVGPFISTLVMDRYRRAGEPRFASLLKERQPVMLLANVGSLMLHLPSQSPEMRGSYRLFDSDIEVLRTNFVHHWGPIWVAGKILRLEPNQQETVEIWVSGTYTLESDQPVWIDGGSGLAPGETVVLDQGLHHIVARRAGVARLRIGARLGVPARPPPRVRLFTGFAFNHPRE